MTCFVLLLERNHIETRYWKIGRGVIGLDSMYKNLQNHFQVFLLIKLHPQFGSDISSEKRCSLSV